MEISRKRIDLESIEKEKITFDQFIEDRWRLLERGSSFNSEEAFFDLSLSLH